MFNDIFKKALCTYNENKESYLNEIKELEEIESRRKFERGVRYIADICDGDLGFNMLQELNPSLRCVVENSEFAVTDIENNMDDSQSEWRYYSWIQVCYCSKGDWKFELWLENIEGDEVVAIKNVRHAKDEDVYINFIVIDELLEFKRLLEFESLDEYLLNKYSMVTDLMGMFGDYCGWEDENALEYTYHRVEGCIEVLGSKIRVNLMENGLMLEVLKDIDDSSRFYYPVYEFCYTGRDDFEELILCVKAYKQHIDGNIGYWEDGQYWGNEYLKSYIEEFKKEKIQHDALNTYQVMLECIDEYDDYTRYCLNKYTGLEINLRIDMTFNDASQWSKGDMINKSVMFVVYNVKQSDKCMLTIRNCVYDRSVTLDVGEMDEEDVSFKKDCVIEGTFLEVLKELDLYINTMLNIHSVSI